MNVTIIGFGEAGPVFGAALKASGHAVTAFDILQNDPARGDRQREKAESLGISPATAASTAVDGADLIISTVTASQAVSAAGDAAAGLSETACWLDINSVSPNTKNSIREIIHTRGADFVEAVAMDTVPTHGIKVPLIFCGPSAAIWSDKLNAIGFNARSLGEQYGKASSTKLIRSVLIKGMEALFAEAIEAAEKIDVVDDVMDSLIATYPGLDWNAVAGYQLSRASLHATRRAAEMRESAAMLDNLGVSPIMATATAAKQQDLAKRELGKNYSGDDIADFLNALRSK